MLLHLLASLRPESGFDLRALHVNHGLSPSARDWEAFCSALCGRLGVNFDARSVAIERAAGASLEAMARDARYKALHSAVRKCNTDIVTLAHHADDQAETVLLQLMRGAAAKGLAAMPEWRTVAGGLQYWRPLLPVPHSALVAYADEHALRWIEDESNSDIDIKRNFLRVTLLPALATAFPGYRSSLARVAAHAASTAALLDEVAERDATSAAAGGRLAVSALRALDPLRAGNLLRWMLADRGLRVPPSERLDEFLRQALTAAPDRHPTLKVDRNFILRAEWGQVQLDQFQSAQPFAVAWRGEASVMLPHGVLSFARVTGGGIRAASVGPDGLIIRTRQGGERLRIATGRPSRTLKNLMQEARIPAVSRACWPLLQQGRVLVAVPGIGVGVDWQCPPQEAGWEPTWNPCAADGTEPPGFVSM